MNTKLKLSIIQFLQFFIWGSWLITAGTYMWSTLGFEGFQIGSIYAALGIASLIMPSVMGIISDKWLPANYLFALCHIISGICLFFAASLTEYTSFYIVMLIGLLFYMPTISLSYSLCYAVINQEKLNPAEAFPPIRAVGTVGFIVAMWIISLADLSKSSSQFIVAAVSSGLLAIITLILVPKLQIIAKTKDEVITLAQRLGLNAFKLLKDKQMAIFFIFATLLGVVLQISNTWANQFVDFVGSTGEEGNLVQRYATIIVSISQISEVVFILLVPYFLRKVGIKYIMIISMLAWFLRFGFFVLADSSFIGLSFIFASMIVYGCAFDFFNISGSIYVEQNAPEQMRNSAQGLFMSLVNGVGGILSGYGSGLVVQHYTSNEGLIAWTNVWLCFAAYALVLAVIFFFIFKNPKKVAA